MKFSGKIGYVRTVQTRPGVHEKKTEEKDAKGDIDCRYAQVTSTDTINNIVLRGKVTIIANKYIEDNFQYIQYVTYKGTKWRVTDAALKYPSIELTLGGGVYNG